MARIPLGMRFCQIMNDNKMLTTSEANDSLFFSPPEIPLNLPAIPMYVSAHFMSPSWNSKAMLKNKKMSLLRHQVRHIETYFAIKVNIDS